jgi:hypothetical protein
VIIIVVVATVAVASYSGATNLLRMIPQLLETDIDCIAMYRLASRR